MDNNNQINYDALMNLRALIRIKKSISKETKEELAKEISTLNLDNDNAEIIKETLEMSKITKEHKQELCKALTEILTKIAIYKLNLFTIKIKNNDKIDITLKKQISDILFWHSTDGILDNMLEKNDYSPTIVPMIKNLIDNLENIPH